jgi:putative phage-type endonuclease
MNSGRIIQCVQGDPTWLHERTGRVTASRVADVVTKLKNGKYSAARETYKMELLTEVLTGRAAEHYVSAEMQFGIENESLARTSFEIDRDVDVKLVGLVIHPTIERASASPDGYVGESGLVEFKCPNTSTHLRYLIDGEIPEDYKFQMLWQMACTGREYCDWVSYDPRLPQDFALFVKRLHRDDAVIAEMEREVQQFVGELNSLCEKLLASKKPAGPGPEAAQIPDAEEWIGRTP